MMRIEIGRYKTPPTSAPIDNLQSKPGLWALVSSYHGRAFILRMGTADNVNRAVSDAARRVRHGERTGKEGHLLYAVKYTDQVELDRLRMFEREVRRRFDLSRDLRTDK